MQSPLNNALLFLINTVFDMYLFVLLLRLILVATRIDYFNPISQIVIKLTQPIILRLRRIIPNYKHIELATVFFTLLVAALKFTLFGLITLTMPNGMGLLILAVAESLQILLNIFFYAILVQVLLSWINPGYSPITLVLAKITDPILRPLQRVIPPIAGFDISPIPAIIIIKLLIMLFISPLYGVGWILAFR